MSFKITYRDFLKKCLESSQSKNPAYSVGAFGRTLGIEASRMGQILNGKVGISVERAIKIAEILKLSEIDRRLFILLVQSEHERNVSKRNEAREKLTSFFKERSHAELALLSVRDWRVFALLEYLTLNTGNQDFYFFCKRFNINNLELEKIILLSIEKGLITKVGNSYLGMVSNSSISDAYFHNNFQLHFLEGFNEDYLNMFARDKKTMKTVFLKFDKAQLDTLNERLSEMLMNFKNEIEAIPTKDTVGYLNIQLFSAE